VGGEGAGWVPGVSVGLLPLPPGGVHRQNNLLAGDVRHTVRRVSDEIEDRTGVGGETPPPPPRRADAWPLRGRGTRASYKREVCREKL
jgi:hypothetical protein